MAKQNIKEIRSKIGGRYLIYIAQERIVKNSLLKCKRKADPIFKKLFNIAEVSNLTSAEMNAYQQSLKIKRDNYNHDQYVLNQGEAKGKYKNSLEIARELKKEGLTVEFIAKTTKLSLDEIEAL